MHSHIIGMRMSKIAKDVNKTVLVNKITIDNYKSVLYKNDMTRRVQYGIISEKHTVYTTEQNKSTLSSF